MNKVLFIVLPGLVVGLILLVVFVALGLGWLGLASAFVMAAGASVGRSGRWRRLVAETGEEPQWSK